MADLADRILLFDTDAETADLYAAGLMLAGFPSVIPADSESAVCCLAALAEAVRLPHRSPGRPAPPGAKFFSSGGAP